MENREKIVKNELFEYFLDAFDIELEDSPQILDSYLYIQYWGLDGDVKLRIPYPVDKEHFLFMNETQRNYWVNTQILSRIIKTSTYQRNIE